MSFIDYDNSFEIINSIIDSTNKLIPLLKINLVLTDSIYLTIEQIFNFMKKALSVLPDFLIVDKRLDALRNEVLNLFDDVAGNWQNFNTKPDEFFQSWELFYLSWEIFVKSLNELKTNKNIVFISMN